MTNYSINSAPINQKLTAINIVEALYDLLELMKLMKLYKLVIQRNKNRKDEIVSSLVEQINTRHANLYCNMKYFLAELDELKGFKELKTGDLSLGGKIKAIKKRLMHFQESIHLINLR